MGMRWSPCTAASEADGGDPPPSPRSGHSATLVGGDRVVVFGGLHGKHFCGDTVVFDVTLARWFRPRAAAVGGPGPRAFHCAVAVDKELYVFCGRTGRTQHGDAWALDTETWSWTDLSRRFPSSAPVAPRDFGTASRVPNTPRILLFGGFDGARWLNDTNVLDTTTGVWRRLVVPVAPGPRSGHAMAAVERRLLVFGGQAPNGTLCGDLWALRGVEPSTSDPSTPAHAQTLPALDDAAGAPRWTRLQLRGVPPSPRTGHAVVAVGHRVVVFGGHGDDGWLVKQQVYYDDAHCVDRATGRWRKMRVEPHPDAGSPSPRAFHALARVDDTRLLLVGGFDGDAALSDAWWLHLDGDDEEGGAGEEKPSAPSAPSAPSSGGLFGGSPFGGLGAPMGAAVGAAAAGGVSRLFAGFGVGSPPTGGFAGFGGFGARNETRGDGSAASGPFGSPAATGRDGGGGGGGRSRDGVDGSLRANENTASTSETSAAKLTLARVLASIERRGAEEDEYPSMGEEGTREFFASCDPEDLRLGDARAALEEYRRAVSAQGLGVPKPDAGEGEGDGREGTPHARGRFMHVAPESLRMGDVPAMMAELQGALIAEAPGRRETS